MAKKPSTETPSNAPEDGRLVYLSVPLQEMIVKNGEAPESLLGDRIRYARSRLALNVEAFGRLTKEYDHQGMGISPTSISRYESGESLPGLREFRLIAESLDVPLGWLLYGSIEEKVSGFSDEEFVLILAMRNFVAARKDDANLGVQAAPNWLKEQSRMEKLNRARKPQGD